MRSVSSPAQKPKPDDTPVPAGRGRALAERLKGDGDRATLAREKDRAEDAALVTRAQKGDGAAFRRLVERNQGRLFAVAIGMLKDSDDAMDVVQDTFIKAHRKLVDFEGNAAFSTWIYRICVNLCIDKKRAEARRRAVQIDDLREGTLGDDTTASVAPTAPRTAGESPLRNVGDKELGAEIDRALALLTPDHKAVVLLREVEGMSYEEIAQALEIPKGTVMSRLFHARKNLQRQLRPYLGLADDRTLDGSRQAGNEDEGSS
jgi:RNA polymerase sigma-70 factor (ECF subfamily)